MAARVTMWEARALPGRGAELAGWLEERVGSAAQVYLGAQDRVVAIGPAPLPVPEPPAGLLARAPQSWEFASYPPEPQA